MASNSPSIPAPLAEWLGEVGGAPALMAVAELLPELAIMVVDAHRDVVWWSPGMASLLGFKPEEVLGRHCLTGVRCERCLGTCDLKTGESGGEIQLLRADGSMAVARRLVRAFLDPEGKFQGGMEILVPVRAGVVTPPPEDYLDFHGILTRDVAMKQAIQVIQNVAETDATVLIRGASGTGKELVARAIHLESHRRKGPFVAVNCGALTPSLLESELFGHVKGAFTGAVSDRPGLFVQASGGTLFLDEVAELPMELQPRLLRVLQEREVVPVGGVKAVHVDVRVLSATHKALREEVRTGHFREDLLYRLRVVPLFLPTLRERPQDIELLLHHFITRFNRRGPRIVEEIAPEAMRILLDHHWPGNVRELQNVMEYSFAVGRGPRITVVDLPPELREGASPRSFPPKMVNTSAVVAPPPSEEEQVQRALEQAGGQSGKAAEWMGVSRTTFWRLRKKYRI